MGVNARKRSGRTWVFAGVFVVCGWCFATAGATAKNAARKAVRSSPWEAAELARDEFEALPETDRTRAEFTRVMDDFRAVYHDSPRDVHAAAAVNAVAQLLTEQGRTLNDAKSLKAAIGQYEFLRLQYPGSSLRVGALLAEGEIYAQDLGDAKAAKERLALLVKLYPGSGLAEQARAELAEPARESGQAGRLREQGTGNREQGTGQGTGDGEQGAGQMAASSRGVAAASSLPPTSPTGGLSKSTGRGLGTTAAGAPAEAMSGSTGDNGGAEAGQSSESKAGQRNGRGHGRLAQVTGIRHWSTANYTRVAIDLGDEVTYEAARVPNPDRIYFDLHGTRLARELVGKSFTVTDDGFLKKVRAAQFSDDMTRVVLDVNDVTEYSAFLLPNPYRLIIDIHGGKSREQGTGNREQQADAVPGDVVPEPRVATTVKPTVGRPVPNTVATKSASAATDVAAVSAQPGRVEATSVPTSQPISAVVKERGRVGGSGNPPFAKDAKDEAPGVNDGAPRDRAAAKDAAGAGAAYPTHRNETAINGAPGSSENPPFAKGAKDGAPGVNDVAPGAVDGDASSQGPGAAAQPAPTNRHGRKGKSAAGVSAKEAAEPARAAVPTADGETSLVRALGLKIGRIVIDAGHGGHDSGTLGVDGLEEKDVVLDVALRVGKLLHDRLGAEVVYTRSDDTFIPLETRTAIANKAQADLFLSIHANSSSDASARGVETYYLNFTSAPDSLEVAARENAVSDQSIHQLSDLVKKIALKEKIDESREFASDVEKSLYGGLARGNAGLKDRGVKKAPFVVLIGANMPSILAEISFVTNPKDARQLREPDYRERVAESLYKGVARYAGGLSGVRGPTERASGR